MAFLGPRKIIGASVSEHPATPSFPDQRFDSGNRALARDLGRPIYAVVS
jgi:hypothetical protein